MPTSYKKTWLETKFFLFKTSLLYIRLCYYINVRRNKGESEKNGIY